jgi:hypothetical protein
MANKWQQGERAMEYITIVRVLVDGTREPLKGVNVELYDRDERSQDDRVGRGTTNQFGEVTFRYHTRDFSCMMKLTEKGWQQQPPAIQSSRRSRGQRWFP